MNDVDALGIPVRNAGERYMYNGRIFTVIKNTNASFYGH